MSDDTPTMAMPATPPPTNESRRTLLVVVSVIAGVLLLAVTVLLTLLLSGLGKTNEQALPSVTPSPSEYGEPSASPSASAEPEGSASTEPSATPSESSAPPAPPPPPPPPVATGPTFTSFSPANNKSVGCSASDGSVPVTFTWASTGANEAAISIGGNDAFTEPYLTGLPPSGSEVINYQCSNASYIYTVSIRGTSGQTNKTITLKR